MIERLFGVASPPKRVASRDHGIMVEQLPALDEQHRPPQPREVEAGRRAARAGPNDTASQTWPSASSGTTSDAIDFTMLCAFLSKQDPLLGTASQKPRGHPDGLLGLMAAFQPPTVAPQLDAGADRLHRDRRKSQSRRSML
jgi:hypothetical protein